MNTLKIRDRIVEIKEIPGSQIRPNPLNWRVHPPAQVGAMKGILAEIGSVDVLKVVPLPDGAYQLVDGHLRAEIMGDQPIRCAVLDLTEEESREVLATFDPLGGLAERNQEMLDDLLDGLESDSEALQELLDTLKGQEVEENKPPEDDEAPIDKAAELQKQWQTERGQMWEIPSKSVPGKCHRVMCGDSTADADVGLLLEGLQPVMMETDPPYGIDYSAIKNGIPCSGFVNHTAQHGDIENDGLTDGAALQAFLEKMIRVALPFMSVTAAYYFWHPMLTQGTFFAAAAAADIIIHRQIIWVKPGFVLTRSGMYHWKHELCFYGWVRGFKPPWYGDKSQTSVWDDFGRDSDHGMHPTQKPIELFIRPMRNHVQRGEWVYEPFGGSGSQVLAAECHGCLCAAMELSPKFLAVILERAKSAGLEPRLIE